ncbi:MAG TPA: hypothetical protein VKO18_01840 [Terriglobia bacterium]|nr:hypothetical protein [Terriglobia bacterium]
MRTSESAGKALLFYLGLAGAVWLVRGWILKGTFQYVILTLIGLLVLGLAGLVFGNWRFGLYALLGWLLFEDMIRKYMGNNMAVYFAKDALVGITYLSFIRASSREKHNKFSAPFLYPLMLFIGLGLIQVFNADSPSILYGLMGLKIYFYYIPLMFVGYSFLRDEEDLRRFLVFNIGIAGVIASIGIAQSVFGLSFLNPKGGADIDYLGNLTRYTSEGVAVSRPPSVFVSDGRFAWYLILAFIVGLGSAGFLLLKKRKGRKIVFSGLLLVSLAGMMSGSRGCASYIVISALVLSAALLWGAPPRRLETYRLFKAIRRSYAVVALGLFLMLAIFPEAIGARWSFYTETLDPRSEHFEAANRAWDYPLRNLMLAFTDPEWPLGHGIGTNSLGVQYVAKIVGPDVDASIHRWDLEDGFATMIFELGILGPILWLIWTGSFVYAAWKTVLLVKGTSTFPLAICIWWFGLLLLFPMTFAGFAPYQNFVYNAYFWLLSGILFSLPRLNEQSSLQPGIDVRHR